LDGAGTIDQAERRHAREDTAMAGVKTTLGVLGLVMLIMGGIWVLQGLNVSWAPQSFMTADINWTYRGAAFAIAGLVLLLFGMRGGWKNVLGGLGALLAVVGAIWVLQGFNVLPGMGMSGHMEWAMRGGVACVIGAALIFIGARGKSAA
jgi:heme/copper-type cytochrome/quinol oxidase subunit 4